MLGDCGRDTVAMGVLLVLMVMWFEYMYHHLMSCGFEYHYLHDVMWFEYYHLMSCDLSID